MFKKMGDMYKLQKQAKQIKNELKNIHIEAEVDGVKIIIDGEQKVVSVEIINPAILQDTKKLCHAIKEAFNRATEKSQKVAAEKMKGVMGGLGFPGM